MSENSDGIRAIVDQASNEAARQALALVGASSGDISPALSDRLDAVMGDWTDILREFAVANVALPEPVFTDPELAAWSDPDVQASVRNMRHDDPQTSAGPTRLSYEVGFMYPHSYTVKAFTVCEAITEALYQFRTVDQIAVHDPQVEWVRVIPTTTRVVAEVEDGAIVGAHVEA